MVDGVGVNAAAAPCTALPLLDVLEHGTTVPEPSTHPASPSTRTRTARSPSRPALGITTRLLADHDRATGRFQVVVRGEDDRLVGVVDPRGSGVAAGLS